MGRASHRPQAGVCLSVTAGVRAASRPLSWISPVRNTEASRLPARRCPFPIPPAYHSPACRDQQQRPLGLVGLPGWPSQPGTAAPPEGAPVAFLATGLQPSHRPRLRWPKVPSRGCLRFAAPLQPRCRAAFDHNCAQRLVCLCPKTLSCHVGRKKIRQRVHHPLSDPLSDYLTI